MYPARRRLAALSLANYLAFLCGDVSGGVVGYKFRFESAVSAKTRILFQTYGSFLQSVLREDCDADWVIFDEFHERRAEMDLLMAYFLSLQKRAPQTTPRIAVLSAELNRGFLESLLKISCLEVGVPYFPVQIIRQESLPGTPREKEIIRALRTLERNRIWKTTLVFLPGKGEIVSAHKAVEEAFGYGKIQLLDLYGGQDFEIQKLIFRETKEPRIIFTTNVAETSLTVPDVTAVVDSGLERTTEYQVKDNFSILRLARISLQNAIQRTGRAGRTGPGVCIRLWGEREEPLFPREIVPEILRSDLTTVILQRAALAKRNGLNPENLVLPTPAPPNAWKNASRRLCDLGFLQSTQGDQNFITPEGIAALEIPTNTVELANFILHAPQLSDLTIAVTAWIDAGRETLSREKEPQNVMHLAENFLENPSWTPRDIQLVFKRLQEYRKQKKILQTSNDTEDTARLFYEAFPSALAMQNGNVYRMEPQTTLVMTNALTGNAKAILAFQLLRTSSREKSELRASFFIPVPESFLRTATEACVYELLWRNGQERYIGVQIKKNGERETGRIEIQPQEASPDILQKLQELTGPAWMEKHTREDLSHLWLDEENKIFLRKMKLAATHFPDYALPLWTEEDIALVTEDFMSGYFLMRDMNAERFRKHLESYFGKNMIPWLQQTFPDTLSLPNGKKAKYLYEEDGLVELSARIADLMPFRGEHFIAKGKVKVRYDILAPNYRTVQKTWDITGFWQNTYPDIRKELRGRYPKHPWPEKVL
jgi:ATP-dependent helicase HrpB